EVKIWTSSSRLRRESGGGRRRGPLRGVASLERARDRDAARRRRGCGPLARALEWIRREHDLRARLHRAVDRHLRTLESERRASRQRALRRSGGAAIRASSSEPQRTVSPAARGAIRADAVRSEEHTSELSHVAISYA